VVDSKEPDLMRINYTLPREEIFFLQKGTCWLYLKEHNYVIKRKLGNDLKEQFFFPNLRKMAQTYQVSLKGRTKDFFHLEFSPYPGKEQNFTKIEIFLNRKLFLPEKIVICDLFGNLTTLHLRKFKINRKIKEEIFNWQPPAEAEVVEP
jgi:outer membrane lipoprotein-sorting protein